MNYSHQCESDGVSRQVSLLPVTYSLNRPPAGMTGFLLLIWPLVFVQLIALKAWVRKHYGPGLPYWYTVSRWGRVSLRHMPIDFTWGYTAPGPLQPTTAQVNLFAPARRLLDALAPEVCVSVAPLHEECRHSVHVQPELARFDTP
ncbi:MAG: hypothetical protein RLO80_02510 [Hyphomonas sp.]